jgi:hypothetical protein
MDTLKKLPNRHLVFIILKMLQRYLIYLWQKHETSKELISIGNSHPTIHLTHLPQFVLIFGKKRRRFLRKRNHYAGAF